MVAIIGVIATIGFVALTGTTDSADDSKIVTDLRAIQSALEVWRAENGDQTNYPTNAAQCQNAYTALNGKLGIDLSFANLTTAGTEYLYMTDKKGTNDDATTYRLIATLNDSSHAALDTDVDSDIAPIATNDDKLGGQAAGRNCDCANPNYCLTNSTKNVEIDL